MRWLNLKGSLDSVKEMISSHPSFLLLLKNFESKLILNSPQIFVYIPFLILFMFKTTSLKGQHIDMFSRECRGIKEC